MVAGAVEALPGGQRVGAAVDKAGAIVGEALRPDTIPAGATAPPPATGGPSPGSSGGGAAPLTGQATPGSATKANRISDGLLSCLTCGARGKQNPAE